MIRKIFLLMLIPISVLSQDDPIHPVSIGDMPPALNIGQWIKGLPIQSFEKGKIYVVEFWAMWCKPCIAAMPHLSTLARAYKDTVTIIAIDVYEYKNKKSSLQKLKFFVDSMGNQMDFLVATDSEKLMEKYWVHASNARQGIPKTFVVNADSKLAWIGHPHELDTILPQIVNNNWSLRKERGKRNFQIRLEEMGDSLNNELMQYRGEAYLHDFFDSTDIGKPDSALYVINKIIKQVPDLEYEPYIVFNTFFSLLKIEPMEAYKYGRKVIDFSSETNCDMIIAAIEECKKKLSLPDEIYELGAEAYQLEINQVYYPQIVDIPKMYHKMAKWYSYACNKEKAIEAQQKAIDILKQRENYSTSVLAEYESQLWAYINM